MISSILFVVLENSGTKVITGSPIPTYEFPFSFHIQLDSSLSKKYLSNITNAHSTMLSATHAHSYLILLADEDRCITPICQKRQ